MAATEIPFAAAAPRARLNKHTAGFADGRLVSIRHAEYTATRTFMHTLHSNILDIQKTGHRAQYTVGRLMSPKEVEEATEDYDHQTRQRVRGHWLLCGDCSQEMFDGIARQGEAALRYSLGVSQRGDDTKFLVITHQLGNAQHRFLVPMWDPRVSNLLEAFSLGQTSISLARKGDTQAVVLSSPRMLRMPWSCESTWTCICPTHSACRRCCEGYLSGWRQRPNLSSFPT